jgi:hypothetical protein
MKPDAFGSNIEPTGAGLFEPRMEPAVIKEPPKQASMEPPKYKEPRVRIVLEDNDNIPPTGQFFGINGNGYILKSGEEADVPVALVNILNDAVWDAPIVDPATHQIIGYRKRLRFPYRVIKASV